jgi:hypothetical protein
MRRAFKVATAFTGAAAFATAFTPALQADAAVARPMGDVIDCPGTANTSVHLYYASDEHHGPLCVGGFEDYTNFGTAHYVQLCAGNNFGSFTSVSHAGAWFYGISLNVIGGHGNYNHESFTLHNGRAEKISNQGWHSSHTKCNY